MTGYNTLNGMPDAPCSRAGIRWRGFLQVNDGEFTMKTNKPEHNQASLREENQFLEEDDRFWKNWLLSLSKGRMPYSLQELIYRIKAEATAEIVAAAKAAEEARAKAAAKAEAALEAAAEAGAWDIRYFKVSEKDKAFWAQNDAWTGAICACLICFGTPYYDAVIAFFKKQGIPFEVLELTMQPSFDALRLAVAMGVLSCEKVGESERDYLYSPAKVIEWIASKTEWRTSFPFTPADLEPVADAPVEGVTAVEPKAEKPLADREREALYNTIGGMLALLLDAVPDGKSKPLYGSQDAIIKTLEERFKGIEGLAERTLAGRFAEAKRTLTESKNMKT